MRRIQRLLLIPSIIPFIIVLLVSILNIKPTIQLKLLTLKTPNIGLGIWLAIGATSGFIFSSATALAIADSNQKFNRKVRTTSNQNQNIRDNKNSQNIYQNNTTELHQQAINHFQNRDIRETPPTISVPYKYVETIHNRSEYNDDNNDNLKYVDEDDDNLNFDYLSDVDIKSTQPDLNNDYKQENKKTELAEWGRPVSDEW